MILVALMTGAYPHIDATADLQSFRLSFIGPAGKDASVEVVYASHISRERIQSIKIDFFDVPVVVPTEELEGIGHIQIDTLQLRYSQYNDGRKYCYVDAIFCSDLGGQPLPGPFTGKVAPVYKRVWLLVVEGEYHERLVFPSISDGRTESTKPRGKPVVIRGKQGGADQPATAPELKSEGKDKPQPESKVRPQ
jgi:hypothetical protein